MSPQEIELQQAQIEMLKDLIKVGIPSFVALTTAVLSVILAVRAKKVDEKIANSEHRLRRDLSKTEARQTSRESLLERKRTHLEQVAADFNDYSNQISIYITQGRKAAGFCERGQQIPSDVMQKLSEYGETSWAAFSQANRAKKLLQLIGFPKTAEMMIDHMSLVSAVRQLVEDSSQTRTFPSVQTLQEKFDTIRSKSKEFLGSLSTNYDSLVLATNDDV